MRPALERGTKREKTRSTEQITADFGQRGNQKAVGRITVAIPPITVSSDHARKEPRIIGADAEAIDTLGVRPAGEFVTYHVMNPHSAGLGMDEFVDWLIDAPEPWRKAA